MARIQLELSADDTAIEGLVSEIGSENVDHAKPDHFEGDINIVNLLIQVTTTTIPVISLFVMEHIRSKRHIKVKMNGIEVQGSELSNVEKLLATLLPKTKAAESEKRNKNTDRKTKKAPPGKKSKKKS